MDKYCMHCMCQVNNEEICPQCGKRIFEEVPAHHLLPGTILNKKYYVGNAIGEGGFGITYLGKDMTLDIKVAIKEYYPNGYVNRSHTISQKIQTSTTKNRKEFFDKGKERFLKEARIIAKFSGEPGIVDVRDFFEENNTVYIVMEYLDGETLKDYLKRKGKLSQEELFTLMEPVMKALKGVHQQGLIHRDISPDNIMIVDGKVKLLDFGAARNATGIDNQSLSVMLKPGYAPEEQYRTKGKQGPWTDIYALCATMYKCLTGVTPSESNERIFDDDLVSPSSIGIAIDEHVERALLKGLNVLQQDRYQCIDDLLKGLQGEAYIEEDLNTVYIEDNQTDDIDDEQDLNTIAVDEDELETVYIDENQEISENQDVNDNQEESTNEEANEEQKQEENHELVSISNENSKVLVVDQKKKKTGFILARIGGFLILFICVVFLITGLGESKKIGGSKKITIADKEFKIDEELVSLYNTTITSEDIEKLTSLKDMYYLSFDNCVFENTDQLDALSSSLRKLIIEKCPSIKDYKWISEYSNISELSIIDSEMTNEQLKEINFNNLTSLEKINLSNKNELSDLSSLNVVIPHLKIVDISNININDILSFENADELMTFHADGNQISDLSPLSSSTQLDTLTISHNAITSLKPLSKLEKLDVLDVSDNALTSLTGLENILRLSKLYADNNEIQDLLGVENCTVLTEVYLSNNQLSNVNILNKSFDTITKLKLGNNPLTYTSLNFSFPKLYYLNLDGLQLEELDVSACTNLKALSVSNNQLSKLVLDNSLILEYVDVSNNHLENVNDLMSISSITTLDISHNNISHIDHSILGDLDILSIQGNPMSNVSFVKLAQVRTFALTFDENFDLSQTDFVNYYIFNCPTDKRVYVEDLHLGNLYLDENEETVKNKILSNMNYYE